MSVSLRVILSIVSVLTCIYVARKLKKSQIQVIDTVFWIMLSILFIILSIFPEIADWCSSLIGVQSPVNFVFLLIIFLLLLRCFLMTIRIVIKC